MKVADAEVIKNAERELMDGIIADLDWGAIEEIIRNKHHLELEEDVEFKHGDLVVLGDRVGYRLEFDVKLRLSLLLDREGNYVSVVTSEGQQTLAEREGDMPGTDGAEEVVEEENKTAEDAHAGEKDKVKKEGYEAAIMAMDETGPVETSD